jgi:hypothetical protein
MRVLLAMLLLMVVSCDTDTVIVELPKCVAVDTTFVSDSTMVVDSTVVSLPFCDV